MSRAWSVRTGLCAVLAALTCAPAANASVSRLQALATAMHALGPAGERSPLIVFSMPTPLSPRARVDQDGPGSGERVSVRRRRFGRRLIVAESSRGIGRRAWLFWADLAPAAQFSHPSVLVLVDAATGKVLRLRRLLWEPLIGGKLPPFLTSARAYLDPAYRVFSRAVDRVAHSAASRSSPAATAAQGAPSGQLGAGLQSAFRYAQSLPGFDLRQTPQLRPGRSSTSQCGVSVSVRSDPFDDAPPWFGSASGGLTWSSSGPATQVGNTVLFGCGTTDLSADCAIVLYGKGDYRFTPNVRALGTITRQLGVPTASATSVSELEHDLSTVPAKCRDVTLMVMAHGAGAQTPWLAPGTLLLPQPQNLLVTSLDFDLLSPAELGQILARHPGRTYNLLIDACYSGNWRNAVNGTAVTSSSTGEESYGATPVTLGNGLMSLSPDAFLQSMATGLGRWKATQGSVVLSAMPAQGSHFDSWESPQGLCAGAGPQCVVRLSPRDPFGQLVLHFGITVFNLTVDNPNPDGGVVSCCNPGRNDVLTAIACGNRPNGTLVEHYTTCSSVVREQQNAADHVGLELTATVAPGVGTYGIVPPVEGCDPGLSVYNSAPAPGGGTYYPTGNCVFDVTGDKKITARWTLVSTQAN